MESQEPVEQAVSDAPDAGTPVARERVRRVFSRPALSIAFTALAGLCLLCGLLAAVVNHEVLDGPRFARHIDAIRRDPAVTREIGRAVTAQVLRAQPDLGAVRPILEPTVTTLVGSPALQPVVRESARQLHSAFTEEKSGSVDVRLADIGAALAQLLPAISPAAAQQIPSDLDVTLASVGAQTAAAQTIHAARIVRLLSWLLPILSLAFFVLAIFVATERRRAVARTGWIIAAVGLFFVAVGISGSIFAALANTHTLDGSLAAAAWRQLAGSLWFTAAATILVGGILILASNGFARFKPFRARTLTLGSAPLPNRFAQVCRGLALILVGLATAFRVPIVLVVVGIIVGVALVLVGIRDVFTAGRAIARRLPSRYGIFAHSRAGFAVSASVVLLAGSAIAVAITRTDDSLAALPANAIGCNGYVELCDRRYDDVTFPGTHNSMMAADESGWFNAEQPTGIIGQLDDGIRVLLIDSWYGQRTSIPGLVVTAPGSHANALASAEAQYGAEAVQAALRLRDALTPTRVGPVTPYLCHELCELGSTQWAPLMVKLRKWLERNKRQVVTLIIQDQVTPSDTAAVFKSAGLLPYVYTQPADRPWPTLGDLIDSGHRLIVFMEDHDGGTEYPWLMPAFKWIQDNPFFNPTPASLSCEHKRGLPNSPILLMNYWLNNFHRIVSDARKINGANDMQPFLDKCKIERRMTPNFVAVNYYNVGSLFSVVARLNGLN